MPLINRCGGGSAELQTKSKDITDPSYPSVEVIPDEGYDGLSKVTVKAKLIERTATPSVESQTIFPYSGYCGLSRVNVEACPWVWDNCTLSSGDVNRGNFTTDMIRYKATNGKRRIPRFILVTQNFSYATSRNADEIVALEITITEYPAGGYQCSVYAYTYGGVPVFESVDEDSVAGGFDTDHFGLGVYDNDDELGWQIALVGSGGYKFNTDDQHHVFAMY